jgi:NPCBM/NEW2 domain.
MKTTPRTGDDDPNIKAALIERSGNVRSAVVSAVGAVVAALVGLAGYLIGKDEGTREGAPAVSAPPATVTVTATTTVTVEPTSAVGTAEPTSTEPPATEPGSLGDGLWLADLTPTGDPLLQGPRKIGDREYPKSLTHRENSCANPRRETLFVLPKPYQRFSATVGVDTDVVFEFSVYLDRDEDGEADDGEQVGTRTAQRNSPGRIDVPLEGVTRVILATDPTGTCIWNTHAIWGDPKVY